MIPVRFNVYGSLGAVQPYNEPVARLPRIAPGGAD